MAGGGKADGNSRLRNGTRHRVFMNIGGADIIVDGEWIENPDLLRGAMKYAKVLHERAFDTSRWLQNLRETPWREKVSDGTRGIAYSGMEKSCCSALYKNYYDS